MIFNPEMGITAESVFKASRLAFIDQKTDGAYSTDRNKEQYNNHVPSLDALSMSEHIEQAARNAIKPINVLDLGAGQAIMLRDWAKKIGDKFKGYALTAQDFRPRTSRMLVDKFFGEIDYKIANAYELDTLYPKDFFDFIVSVQCFRYLADPVGALEKVFNHLPVGGKTFIHNPKLFLSGEEQAYLNAYLLHSGIRANLDRVFAKDDLTKQVQHNVAAERIGAGHVNLPFIYLPPTGLYTSQFNYQLVK